MSKKPIKLGPSPDPDDAFMFYGLACGAVDSGPFEFEHVLRDIQTLNDWARQTRLEITAISVHAYPYVQGDYAILATGASMGATELAAYTPDDATPAAPPTIDPAYATAAQFVDTLRENGLLALAAGKEFVRLVTHLDGSTDDCQSAGATLLRLAG